MKISYTICGNSFALGFFFAAFVVNLVARRGLWACLDAMMMLLLLHFLKD
jgi:hypothetical protein